jgi:hypothetical protein
MMHRLFPCFYFCVPLAALVLGGVFLMLKNQQVQNLKRTGDRG